MIRTILLLLITGNLYAQTVTVTSDGRLQANCPVCPPPVVIRDTVTITRTVRDTVYVDKPPVITQPPSTAGCNQNKPISYTVAPTKPGEIYITNGWTKGWKGGDTLRIPAGDYSIIQIDSFGGDPCRDIVITNSGGLVKSTTIRLNSDVHHVKVMGNGVQGIPYGFKTGVFAFNRVNHFTMEWIECGPNPAGVGIYGKQDPYADKPWTWYPNYTSTKITIRNCYVHDVSGEGMYIGHTYPGGDPYNSNLVAIRLDSVTISDNIVTNCGWDGIQLSNARNGAQIFNNKVTNFGTLDLDGQRAGIILGGNTSGSVYNNIVTTGTGNGIQFFGYGKLQCYNNVITSVGNTKKNVNGEESIYFIDKPTTPETNPKQAMIISGNTINYPKPLGAIRGNYTGYSDQVILQNNKFCFISTAPSDWKTRYIFVRMPYTDINNVLSCN